MRFLPPIASIAFVASMSLEVVESFAPTRASRLGGIAPRLFAVTGTGTDYDAPKTSRPKAIVFDLDGCLWKPEMYELVWFSKGQGAPFTSHPEEPGALMSVAGEPIRLLGDVREVMRELLEDPKWKDCCIGISSRTDEPNWARELLQKFTIEEQPDPDTDERPAVIQDVFEKSPIIEIAKDGKVQHFQRIANTLGISFGDMLFFDNESGNCREVARLGVTVAYCPDGVDRRIWDVALEAFPQTGGDVVGLDVFGYDSLEGAERFY